jgi:hypothetical protein
MSKSVATLMAGPLATGAVKGGSRDGRLVRDSGQLQRWPAGTQERVDLDGQAAMERSEHGVSSPAWSDAARQQ